MHISTPTTAPTRARPYEKTQKPTPAWVRLMLGRDMAPSRDEYDDVVAAMTVGDPVMDAYIDWMFSHEPRLGHQLFNQALEHGIDSIADAPEPLRALFRVVDTEPAWLDRELINDGARFIHGTGMAAPIVLRDLALMGGYLLSGFNQSLVMTGALSNGTSQRIAETGKWWIDCTSIDGLGRHGTGFKSTLHVRLVHGLVRRNLSNKAEWDHATWGLPLSQIDMVATYLGFSVVMLNGLRMLGIPTTPHESRAVMHLWSYACWLMGVDEKWLAFTEGKGSVLLNHSLMTQSPPDWTSKELGRALAEEPLSLTFPRLQGIRRRLAYHQHLSVSRYFLGKKQMRQLGLPDNVLPWFPLLTLPPRLLSYSTHRLLPGLRDVQQRRGRQAQLDILAATFGKQEQGIIKPDANHPAHIKP